MKKILVSGIVCMIFSVSVLSQVIDPIVVNKKGLGTQYMQNDQILKRKEIVLVLNEYPPSAKELKIANTYSIIGGSLIGAGALVIGVSSLASTLKDVKALNTGSGDFADLNNNTPFYIGVALAVAGLPFGLIGNSHFVNSIVLYNAQNNSGKISDIKLSAGITSAGFGIRLQF